MSSSPNLFAPPDLFASASPPPVPMPEEAPPAPFPEKVPLPPIGGPPTGRRPAPSDRLFASPDEPVRVEMQKQERLFAHPDEVEEYRPKRPNSWPYLLVGAGAAYFVWTQVNRPKELVLPPPPPIILVPTEAPGPPMPRMIEEEPPAQVSVTPVAPVGQPPAGSSPPSYGELGSREWLFTGRFRDAITLQPVSAHVVFDDFSSGRKKRVRTDARGRFRVKLPVAEGDGYFLKVEKEGYLDRYILEGDEVARSPQSERRERAKTAARSVQRVPLSPLAEGQLTLDVLLIPAGLE